MATTEGETGVTEQEAMNVIRGCGWSVIIRPRRGKQAYIYAQRKVKGKRVEVYAGSFRTLANMTEEQLRSKLS